MLPERFQERLVELLKDVRTELTEGGSAKVPPITLEVDGSAVRAQHRRLSPDMVEKAKYIVGDLLRRRLVSVAKAGDWCSPSHFVKKRDGTWRLTIDFRAVNSQTRTSHHPLPSTKWLLAGLSGMRVFSKLDLAHGFWNLRLDEVSKKYTGFHVPGVGTYRWEVLPQGFKTSPTEFQRVMEEVLAGEISTGEVIIYLDDILIATQDEARHLEVIKRVLGRIQQAELCLKLNKCEFMKRELDILGLTSRKA